MSGDKGQDEVKIERYDRLIDEYISLGNYTALHSMNTEYPQQTKVLIEDVLKLGNVFDAGIENKLREHYMDSIPQLLLEEVHHQYLDISDIEDGFKDAFKSFREEHPQYPLPHIYMQVSCLKQSIVVSDTLVGISLDKYLGADFPLYVIMYSPEQRQLMTREHIVPDAMKAYLDYCQQKK